MSKQYWPAFILIFLGILYLTTLNKELCGLGGDNAQYIFLAESLFQGKGYRTINQPKEPIHNTYPPGYPLLLLPIIALAGRNFLLMHIEIIIFSLLSLTFLYAINKDLFSNHKIFPIIVMFVFGLHPGRVERNSNVGIVQYIGNAYFSKDNVLLFVGFTDL